MASVPRIAVERGRKMLTAEENEMLTRVGPGTPAGELLRRYWHPVAIAADLTPENPTKFVRILGEDLVLFVTPKGEPGLLHDRCSHRGVVAVLWPCRRAGPRVRLSRLALRHRRATV